MKMAWSFLLIAIMLTGAFTAAVAPQRVSEPAMESPCSLKTDMPGQTSAGTPDEGLDASMMHYLQGLDPSDPILSEPPRPSEPSPERGSSRLTPIFTKVVLFYENPLVRDQWLPLPTEEDIMTGSVPPVSFANMSWLEVHGKLYESIVDENTTYFDDVGISNLIINVTFDGEPIPGGTNLHTGDRYTYNEPFGDNGNGTFRFLIFLDKIAGRYEIGIDLVGMHSGIVLPRYTAEIHVSHPTVIALDGLQPAYRVGKDIHIAGSLSDDTGRNIPGVPLQIWFDDELLGRSSDGVYIDDVTVHGTGYFENFDHPGDRGWSVYSSPAFVADAQWEHGIPDIDQGPYVAHSGTRLWGTDLGGDYQRGAWSFLVSPPMDLSEDRSYTLSFWAWWSLYWSEDLAYVMASTDGGSTWDEEGSMTFTEEGLRSDDWTLCEYNVTRYQGSSDVRFAFVFYSDYTTLVTRTDSTFEYTHHLPNSTTADRHTVTVRFEGNLLFQEGQLELGIDVKRITHIEFDQNVSTKICHRSQPIELVAWLKDNEGEVPSSNINDHAYYYYIRTFWNNTRTIWDSFGWWSTGIMDPETGKCSILFVVPHDQPPGPTNVTFRFPGDDYYTAVQQTDVYIVKAKTYLRLLDDAEWRGYRGQTINIGAELRVVPDQSVIDKVLGDPLPNEILKIYWDRQPIGNRRTTFDGTPTAEYLIPSTHRLGTVVVSFIYEGSLLYDPVTRYENYIVGSDTFITIEDSTVESGDWTYIRGTVTDDRGEPAPSLQVHIIWKRAPEIGRATTKADGTFSIQYYIQYEEKPGDINVIARFLGDMVYSAAEANATYTIAALTILVRSDHTSSLFLGEHAILSAKLYQWSGYRRGDEVQNEMVDLSIDGVIVESKATSYDGSVGFTVWFDPELYSYGERSIRLRYGGNERHSGSTLSFKILVRFQGSVTFSEFFVNGQVADPWKDTLGMGDTITGRIRVVDEDGSPLPGKKVVVHYFENPFGSGWVDIAQGRTDAEGLFWFQSVIHVPRGGILTFIGECEVLTAEEYPEIHMTYIVPPPPTDRPIVSSTGGQLAAVGERFTLEVEVRDAREWDADTLVYRLVSPPEGMTISRDGIINWTPGGDQVGDHNITVWVSDGTRSETTVLTVSVAEESDGYGSYGWFSAFLVMILLVGLIFMIRYMRRRKVT